MTWNYRVIKKTTPFNEELYEIVEAYYDDNGKIEYYLESGIFAETEAGVKWQLNKMAESLQKEILTEYNIIGSK